MRCFQPCSRERVERRRRRRERGYTGDSAGKAAGQTVRLSGFDEDLLGGGQHAFNITRNQVNFQIDLAVDFQVLECGDLNRVRNQVDREAAAAGDVFHTVDGERNAVDYDGAFVGEILVECRRGFDDQFPGFADRFKFAHHAEAVDVAGDQMAAEAFCQGQGFFQIDFARCIKTGGEVEALARDVDGETFGGLFDDGHAGAVEGNRITQRDVVHRQCAGIDVKAHACVGGVAQRLNGSDFADSGNDACKHNEAQIN